MFAFLALYSKVKEHERDEAREERDTKRKEEDT